jgi:hypothetical protein
MWTSYPRSCRKLTSPANIIPNDRELSLFKTDQVQIQPRQNDEPS